MKTIRRMIALLLTLALLLMDFGIRGFQKEAKAETSAPTGIIGTNDVGTQPDELLQSGEWLYYLDGEEAIIAGYSNNEETLSIPFRLDKHRVTGIANDAFTNNYLLKTIQIHSLVSRIGDKAFEYGQNISISAYNGSYALQYAEKHGIKSVNLSEYSFAEKVLDFSGMPKKSYSNLDNRSVIVDSYLVDKYIVAGQVLFFPPQSNLPTGYAARIESISLRNEVATLALGEPDPKDVFLEIKIDNEPLFVDWSNAQPSQEGVSFQASTVSSSGVEFKSYKDSSASISFANVKLMDGIKLNGSISIGSIKPNASAHVDVLRMKLISADFDVQVKSNIKLKVTASEAAKKGNQSGYGKAFNRIALGTIPVASIGFVINGYITLYLKGSISGSFSLEYEKTVGFGLHYANGKLTHTKHQNARLQNIKIEASAKIGPELALYFVIGVAGLSIRFIEADVAINAVVSASATYTYDIPERSTPFACADVKVAIELEITGKAGILKVFSKDYEIGISKSWTPVSWQIASLHIDDGLMVNSCNLKNRQLVFDFGYGGVTEQRTYNVKDYITEIGACRDGFTFDGWYLSKHASGLSGQDRKWNFATDRMPYTEYGPIVLYAQWINNATGEKENPSIIDRPTQHTEGWPVWHPEPPKPVEVTGITLNKSDEVLHVDGQYKDKLYLYAVVSPTNADDTSVTWSSSNPAVATVDQNGVVSAVAQNGDNHETIITCTSNMNPGVKAECKVNVFEPIYVNSIALDKTNAELWANEAENNTLQLKATVDPANATYSSVHWSSSDEGVAWVDGWGKVTALSAGTATITCRSIKNQDVTATCRVTVHQHVSDVYVTAERDGLLPTETVQLNALCYPTNADNTNVNWTSSDETVASVDARGLATARDYGTATITATATDGSGVAGNYILTVEHELSLIGDVQNDTLYLDGDSGVIIGHAYATQGSVRRMVERGYDMEWSLLNGENEFADAYIDVVSTTYTVDGKDYEVPSVVLYSGELHKAGNATYTLQCKAGSYTATVDLTTSVSGDKLAKSVTLNPSKYELAMNEVAHIPAAPTATDGGVVPKILTVSLSGDAYYRSHAHLSSDELGLCVWFPESGQYAADVVYEAANISYTVPVTFEVRDEDGIMHLPVTDVAIGDSFVNMVVGDTYQLSATVLPMDAYDRSISWASEDENIASVSDDGLVTAKARGMVCIRCEANDGSGYYDTCVLNIEPFMALNETDIEKTIYLSGQTNVSIDSCSLTYQSAIRIENAGLTPNWTLRRISGNATEIALNEFTSTTEGSVRIEGEEINLLRANHTGVDQYQLTCEAGDYSANCDITLTVVEGDNLPASITLNTNSYEAEVGEEIEIDTAITCLPGGAELPEDVNITIDPSKGFWNAMQDGTYFADFHCTFATAGEYTAELVYSGANYRYAVPFTVRVKDATGTVPVAVQDIVISNESIQLLVGDSFQLSASVLPSNAAYGSIAWSSFDTSIATVSTNGNVTAIDTGNTYVIASTENSDSSTICLVTVEDGLTLENDSITKTVYVDGATRTALDTVFLTESSSKRLTAAPEWKLQRISGNNLTLRCSGVESANENGDTLYGCNIILHSASAVGQTIYDLVCSYGNERATMRIIVNAVARDGNAPASIELSQKSYEANVNELIVVNPQVTCWPSGTQLPEGTRVEFIGNRQFLEAVNQQDWFVSQSISTFSFNEAGRYEANCVYSYSNISYTIPITFYIKDNNGSVPVHGTKMALNTTSLQMITGDQGQLDAVFTPSDVTDSNVTWVSSNTDVATVDASGRVEAKANGVAQITCTPSDTHCSAVTCYVTVEDYLTVETGNTSYSCYLEGKPENLLSSAWLSEGTQQRLNRDNIVPTWALTTTNGSSAVVAGTPEIDGSAIRVSTVSLTSTGTTQYTITCTAGEYQWSQSYSVVINSSEAQAPERVTLATPEVNLAVGEVKTIDFTPVCQPSGTSLPQSIISTYVGLGAFYDNLDRSVYEMNGDRVTVAFTEPGRYLLTRVYRVLNLDYTALCVINVGSTNIDEFGLLNATEQECVVYMNGKSGAVSTISINDSTVYERYGSEIQWRAERLSGDSITAGLVANGDTVTLFVGDAEKIGTDVWRVSCSFGTITDYVDVSIEVKEARKPIPSSIELSKQRITGVTGDWLYLPLGVKCSPEGSALPETGDDFWQFKMTGGLGEDVSESKIENGMLAVCFSESGYYSGTLVYIAGTISYKLPVYFTISDEESQIDTPDQLRVWVLKDSDAIYPEGDVGIPIATAIVAENLNSYYAGTVPSYVEEKGVNWSITITSGNAVTLAVQRNTANTSDVMLKSIKGAGNVEYTVSCTIDGKTYTGNGSLHVATSDEARPDVTLIKSRYQVTQGIPAEISRMLYQRSTGGSLQAAGDWNVGNALAAIGYSYETTDDSWKVTFYKQGEYTTTVSTYVGNLKYDLPLTITVVGQGTQEQLRTLKLPAALTLIEEEAFSGLSVQVIDLRGTKVKTIESNAFKNCVDLLEIYIPNSVTTIASNAFYGCLNVTIHCVQGSSADSFATANKINVSYDMD